MIPVYVINLPEDFDRLEVIRGQVRTFCSVEPTRVEAVRGRLIPDVACRILTRNIYSVNHKGTLGCFLSHVRAWELIAQGDAQWGLVIEDDVELQHLDKLDVSLIPHDCDLLWCNGRTAYPSSRDDMFRPIFPALAFIESHGRAIGGDCYLLSKKGAQALLSFVQIDSLFTHVDLRLMAYSLDIPQAHALKNLGQISQHVSELRLSYPLDHKLVSYSFWPPIGIHMSIPSRRAAEDVFGERTIG